MVQIRMSGEEDELKSVRESASEWLGSRERSERAFEWPFSLWRISPVDMSQMMIVASAEPEMRMGVPFTEVARTDLRKSVWPDCFRMLVGCWSGIA